MPFPVNPCLQVQLKEPSLLVQSAFSSQGVASAEHSSMSDFDVDKLNRETISTVGVFVVSLKQVRIICAFIHKNDEGRGI